jgi:glycosyltransferase involved in cell wall biosynthesis
MNRMNEQRATATTPVVDIAIPVHNEEHDVETSVRTLHTHLSSNIPFSSRITIVDNASEDGTRLIGARLARDLDSVRSIHIAEKGRGRALRTAWLSSDAEVVAYMDVDLSTDLAALRPLLEPLVSEQADIAIGSRLTRGAWVTRSLQRECISRGYNLLLCAALQTRFRDAQCGFKAMRNQVARTLLPRVRGQGWFFDTELLVLGQRAGLRIREVPVRWIEDPDSRVDIPSTVMTDLRGVWRMLRDTPNLRPRLWPSAAHAQDPR